MSLLDEINPPAWESSPAAASHSAGVARPSGERWAADTRPACLCTCEWCWGQAPDDSCQQSAAIFTSEVPRNNTIIPGNRPSSGFHVAHCIPWLKGGRALFSFMQGSADNDPTTDTTPYCLCVCLSLPQLVCIFRLEPMQQIAATHIFHSCARLNRTPRVFCRKYAQPETCVTAALVLLVQLNFKSWMCTVPLLWYLEVTRSISFMASHNTLLKYECSVYTLPAVVLPPSMSEELLSVGWWFRKVERSLLLTWHCSP